MDDQKDIKVPEENPAPDVSSAEEAATPDNAGADVAVEEPQVDEEASPEAAEEPAGDAAGESADEVAEEPAGEASDESADEVAEEPAGEDTPAETDDVDAESPAETPGEEDNNADPLEGVDKSAMTDEERAMLESMDDIPDNDSVGDGDGLLSQADIDQAILQGEVDSGGDNDIPGGILDTAGGAMAGAGSAAASDDEEVRQADFQQLSESGRQKQPRNIDLLMDVDLPVAIELGRTRMNIADILALGPGSVVELEKLVGEPVDLLVNQKCVARGEVVVVEENFGLRITELVSPEERIKNLK